MVTDENHHIVKILIYKVVREDIIHTRHSLTPARIILRKRCPDGVVKREVHNGRKVGVESVLVHVVILPVCKLRDRRSPALAHYVEVRIFLPHSSTPLAHRVLLVIWICIHTESVKARIFNPPCSPLLEILKHIRIVKVHIRHRRHEPSALLHVQILL